MTTIELNDVILHGHHGVHREEELVMNTFEVSLRVVFDEKKSEFDKLEDTISYVDLYEIVQKKVAVRVLLLEKLCQAIIRKIKHQYPFVKEVTITVHKLQAPIRNFQGRVGVTMRKKFDD